MVCIIFALGSSAVIATRYIYAVGQARFDAKVCELELLVCLLKEHAGGEAGEAP